MQGNQPIAFALGVGPGFQRRRGRAEQDRNTQQARAKNRHVARRVAHAVLLLERWIVLLVDDDQAKPRQRREDRQPGTEDDARFTGECRPPVALAGGFSQFAVQRHDRAFRKTRPDPPFELRRQIDFRHQQQHLPSGRQHPIDQAQINLRLAAAGDAMEQIGTESGLRIDGAQGGELLRRQFRRTRQLRRANRTRRTPDRHGEPFQPGGKRLHDDFAERRLIVSTGKLAELEKVAGKRRQIAQDVTCRFQLRRGPVAAVHHLGNDADSFTLSKRYPNPEADVGRRSRRRRIVEQAMQRQIEGDTEDRHGRLLAMLDKPLSNQGLLACPQKLWITLWIAFGRLC